MATGDRLAKANAERLDVDVAPFGGQEVAEFVEEDDESESKYEGGDGENIGQCHRAVPSYSYVQASGIR